MKNFFRKDLNLSAKRWHRLLVVIFFIAFLVLLFIQLKDTLQSDIFWPIYTVQWQVKDRLSSKVVTPKELAQKWEIIGRNYNPVWILGFSFKKDKYQNLLSYDQDSFIYGEFDRIFCTDQLESKIDKIMQITNIYEIHQNYPTFLNNGWSQAPRDQINQYIGSKNIKCVCINGVFWENNKYLDLELWKDYQEYNFYKKTNTKLLETINKISYFITFSFLLTIPFLLLIIIYYRVILYVIYWKTKNKPNKRKNN